MEPPVPSGARSVDELVCRLRELRGWSGLSEREVHRQVVRSRKARGIPELPSYDTVHRCFQLGRSRLNVDLVVDIARVLRGDETAAVRWRTAYARIVGEAAEAAVVTVSGTLPDEPTAFTGRSAELARLLDARVLPGPRTAPEDTPAAAGGPDAAAAPPGTTGVPAPPPISVIEGMAGVGKTTLAVHAAHRLRRQHRLDTVLWVNLRGYAADAPPADPAAVLEGFLRRLGMSPDRIRLLDTPSRAREFRSRLSGRRTLVVLDNAVDEDQVRHLLPGPRSALTLVTSRHAMSGLAEARRLRLDVFTPGEALQLLREMTGADRIDTDLATAGQIADSVGHLPLALGVVASRIRSSHGWTLADHLERLRGHRSQLKFDDRVELALGLSYEGLDEDCRRVFRLLSLHPGQDTDAYAAAALAGSGLETTRRHLGTLLAANLLRRPAPGRYEFHDLVRIYATGRAHDEDPGQARRAAFTRLVEHYWDTAARAMDRYAPHEAPHGRPAGTAGGADPARAGAAGDTIAAGGGAARGGESLDGGVRVEGARDGGAPGGAQRRAGAAADPPTAHDPDARGPATRDPAPAPVPAAAPVPSAAAAADARGLLPEQGAPAPVLPDRSAATAWLAAEWAGLIATAASAADHGDPRHAGRLSAILFRYLDTCGHYKEAEVLHTHGARTPDPDDRAWALTNLGLTYWRLGRCPDTLDALGRALEQYRVIGDRIGECRSLGCIGEVHQFLGHRAETGEHFTAALATARAVADAHGSSAAGPARTGRRAVLYEPLGRYEKVYEQPEQIIALGLELLACIRRTGDRVGEGRLLGSLGSVHRQSGGHQEALAHLRQALALARETGNYTGETDVLIELGQTAQAMAEESAPTRALRYHRQAAALAADLGDRYQQARAQDGIAHCHAVLGDLNAARTHWHRALGLFTDLGTPESEAVTRRLEALGTA